MASASFHNAIKAFGNNAGIEVPPSALDELGGGKRPPVTVTIGDYSWNTTLGVMGGISLISLSKAHRDASGLKAGDPVTVTLELDQGPREIEVPSELQAALEDAGLTERFEALSYSTRKEHARQVREAKSSDTRQRRIAKVLSQMDAT